MPITRSLLWSAAVIFVGIGIAFLFWPVPLGGMVEISLQSPTAWTDFLATYGGLQLGFGIFLVICARRPERTRVGLLAAGCALAGFAGGRIYGLATAAGAPKPIIYGYLALEVFGAAVAFWAARRSSR